MILMVENGVVIMQKIKTQNPKVARLLTHNQKSTNFILGVKVYKGISRDRVLSVVYFEFNVRNLKCLLYCAVPLRNCIKGEVNPNI